MALYISYLVGASVGTYITQNIYNYMVSEEYDSEEINNNIKENTFLKISEEPIILESTVEEEIIETIDNKDILESIVEEEIIETIDNNDVIETIETIETIDNKDVNKLETIIEVKDTIFCCKCKLYLPHKCFSKNQFKKYRRLPSCKICTKLK